MSTHAEELTLALKWTKPLMVSVPLLVLLTFFYSACQFKEPDFPFVPKGAKVERLYVILDKGYGPPVRPLAEVTMFSWSLNNAKEWDTVRKEIFAKGFTPSEKLKQTPPYATFNHPNGDRLEFRAGEKPNSVTDLSGGHLIFVHEETRPVHEKIKRFMLWVKNRK